MEELQIPVGKKKVRLKFIDMARSVAILLMLEGHFVDDSLSLEFRDPNNPIYATWYFIRAFTAPIFLSVTGIIFTYLLLKTKQQPYFKSLRVKKGFKRVLELFFWGYLVQSTGFHVLECIAVGIFSILTCYGLFKLIRFIPLWIFFFVSSIATFSFYLYLGELPEGAPWPAGFPHFIQNAFHGTIQHAIFPIIPFMGYTLFGAMIGTIIYNYEKDVKKWGFLLSFMLFGVLLFFFTQQILWGIDGAIHYFHPDFGYPYTNLVWVYERLGFVVMELSLLMLIDKLWGEKIIEGNLFLRIGQNTLTIYVLHMIVLYGSISGLGLNKHFRKALGPWEVAIGASLFILLFVILIIYLERIKKALSFVLLPIKKFFNRLFFISN
tara:strand:+ start:9202 stop:10338 length:1137 start_codon:yes stop_codon:yes gene_type:complete